MSLDFSNLEKVVSLMRAIYLKAEDKLFMSSLDDVTQNAIRAGVIQHFEMVYELSCKFMQRWIKLNLSVEEANYPRTRKELFRLAAKAGLIEEPSRWFIYGDARNMTSHTYNQETADEVYQSAYGLINDATYLLTQLKINHD